ncbi:MAG: TonB family protein [Candidatus Acidiferrum sp.]
MAATDKSNPIGSTPSASSQQPAEARPVAHEAPVTATGARPGANSGKRELFAEDTTTALVFPNGGVIRLSVEVEPGQLIFLTNQQSKREVVAQVTRRRNNPAAGYYVEFEFTEPSPGFWGIQLPASPAAVPASVHQQPALASLHSAEANPEGPGPRASILSASEIQGLLGEDEAPRGNPESLQTQSVAANSGTPVVAAPSLPGPSASVPLSKSPDQPESPKLATPNPSSAALPPLSELFSSLLPPAAPQAAVPLKNSAACEPATPISSSASLPPLSELLSTFLAPAATAATPRQTTEAVEPRTPSARTMPSTLAVEEPAEDEESIPEEEFVPNEELAAEPVAGLQKAKVSVEISPSNRPNAEPADRMALMRLALLAAVSLFAVTVAAWNMHWFPWSSGPANLSGHASSPSRAPARSVPQQKSDAPFNSSAPPQDTRTVPAQLNAVDAASAQTSNSAVGASPAHASREPASPSHATANPAPRSDSEPVKSVAHDSIATPTSSAEDISASSSNDGAPNTPPRLIKSVRAVAPSDALRDYVTGNVTIDALIDESGHVTSMKILSGPAMLHKAAIEALRQYRYEPARKNGKRVSAHVTVTVPFWFEP